MALFEEITSNKTLEEQATEINALLKKTSKPYKHSRNFAKDTGLGVIFSKVEKYFSKMGYVFNGEEFIKEQGKKQEQAETTGQTKSKNDIIVDYLTNNDRGKLKKGSFQMYESAEKELNELYEKYPYFNKRDLLYIVIMEGVKNLK